MTYDPTWVHYDILRNCLYSSVADSESEVWSRSLPQVYNSAPSDRGKRARPSLSTAFTMNVDQGARGREMGQVG